MVFVFAPFGTAEEFAAVAELLEGKIAVCSRGETPFSAKANAAVENGAIATIVYNNQPGTINMDLSDYAYTAPCISITQADGALLKANAEAVTGEDGETLCYVGTLTVSDRIAVAKGSGDYYTMSSFSSWGVPGNLTLKPEITAPGGSIYSVNGQTPGGTAYENMSGTSMAAPQVAGMAALVKQYIQENGLADKTDLSIRALTQSLLMSTAEPLMEEASGSYWSVLKQGAGLANVNAAISADSYIRMGEDATASASDGKVKAELGDDPERTGSYTFSFTLNNLTDSEKEYTFSSDFFTQNILEIEEKSCMDTQTVALPVEVTYTVEGQEFVPTTALECDLDGDGDTDADDAQVILNYVAGLTDTLDEIADLDGDGSFTTYDAHILLSSMEVSKVAVAAGDAVNVVVTVVLPETVKSYLNENYLNGAYLEGYVYVIPAATEEGVTAPVHSIPVLGFYGSWTDSSMYDQITREEYFYGIGDDPYVAIANGLVVRMAGESSVSDYLTNPYLVETPIPTERRAINSGTMLYSQYVSVIRNAAASALVVLDSDGRILEMNNFSTEDTGAYFYVNGSAWQNTYKLLYYYRLVSSLGLKEGDTFTIAYVAVPEYYFPDGNATQEQLAELIESGELGDGAFMATTLTVDNTAPEITGITKNLMTDELTITATDNQYIAAVQVYDNNGAKLLASSLMDQEQPGGGSVTLDLSGVQVGAKCLVRVADYAGNESTYRLSYGGQEEDYTGKMYGFLSTGTANYRGTGNRWVEITPEVLYYYSGEYEGTETVAPSDIRVQAAEYVGGYVYMYASDGYLYVAPQGDWTNYQTLCRIGPSNSVLDMAFNYADGKLYAMMENNEVYSIDLITGDLTLEFQISITNPRTTSATYRVLKGLAIDDEGTFYSANQASNAYAYLYKWTKDDAVDGVITDLAPVNNTTTGRLERDFLYLKGCLAWDHDQDVLYMYSNSQRADNVGSSNESLTIVNTETGKTTLATDYDGGSGNKWAPSRFFTGVSGAYIVPSETVTIMPSNEVCRLILSDTELTLLDGAVRKLKAEVYPWTLSDRSVTWSSGDETIASVTADGIVTATGIGTTTITAAASADPTVTVSCTITVTEIPDITLSALMKDSSGDSYWTEFQITDLKGWSKLSDKTDGFLAGASMVDDQRLVVHDGEHIYSVDPDSFAVTDLGSIDSSWLWTDGAQAPELGEGKFGYVAVIGADGRNLYMINPVDGRAGGWNLSGTFITDPMAAIAYAGVSEYSGKDALHYYVVTESGELYQFLTYYAAANATSPTLYAQHLGSLEIELPGSAILNSGKRATMQYDAETGYLILAYSQPGAQAQVYAIDPLNVSMAPIGTFDSTVSSVLSLYQYEQVTDLTVRLRAGATSIYEDETVSCEAHVLPVSYKDQVVWTSSDPSVATVNQEGLVSGVSAGTVTITATSVACDAAGQVASASVEIEVKALAHPDTEVHALLTTEDGSQWVTINASDLSYTVEGTAQHQFTGGGAHNGKLYGIPTDYESTSHFYVIDPDHDFAEEKGSGCVSGYAPLDLTTAPADSTTVTTSSGEKVTLETFNYPTYIANNKMLILLLDPIEGIISGWNSLSVSDAAAITYKGVGKFAYAGNAKTQDFVLLGTSGSLYLVQVWPNYNKKTDTLGYSMTRTALGNCGTEFADDTKLTMTYVDTEEHTGVIVADSSDGVTLYFIDLSGKTPVCTKIGSIPGATAISTLYSDSDLGVTEEPADESDSIDVAADSEETFFSWYALSEPMPEIEMAAELNLAELTANETDGGTQSTVRMGNRVHPAPTETEVQQEETGLTLSLTEDVDVTNGLIQVSYDPEVLTLDSVDTLIVNHAVNIDAENGTVVFDYAAAQAVSAGATLAQIHFTFAGEPRNTEFEVSVLERNQELTLQETQTIVVEVPCDGKGDCPTAKFEDLSADAWYHPYTDYVLSHGLMVGVSGTQFAPNTAATRCQMIAVLYRMEGSPETDGVNPFVDVAEGTYYIDAVRWAADNGIVYGVDATHFAPNQPITREQMVAILYRYAGYKGESTDASGDLSAFADGDAVSRYARTAMSWAVENGLVYGTTSTTLDPQGSCIRVQMAVILARYCMKFQ